MHQTIAAFPQQLVQTWQELNKWQPPLNTTILRNIVTVGMGGSGLGADFINALFYDKLKLPHIIIHDYDLPGFVNENSLIFLISYSGKTQETLGAGEEAWEEIKKRNTKIISITTGNNLAKFSTSRKIPSWIFQPKFNFCAEPRMGLGYLILGQVLILRNLGLIEFTEHDFSRVLAVTKDACQKFGIEAETSKNLAKSTAAELFGKIPVIFAAQYLTGNAHIISNQINENAKIASFWLPIPEADHHFLEAVKSPLSKESLVFINLLSEFYDDGIKKRFEVANQLAQQFMIKVIDIKLKAEIPLEECFAMLVLSSWISFYLAILQGIDPTSISTVEYLKDRLYH